MKSPRIVKLPRLTKADFELRLPALRNGLLDAQYALQKEKGGAVVMLITDIPTAGRSEVVNQFLEWLDPKHVSVYAGRKRQTTAMPALWHYWQRIPARGRLAIYFAGWYDDYLAGRLSSRKKVRRREQHAAERIVKLETMLVRDRVKVVKLHLHVDEKTQRERIRKLRADKLTRWRITREDRRHAKHYQQVCQALQSCHEATHHKAAPWHILDGTDPQSRLLAAGNLLLDALKDASQAGKRPPAHPWANIGSRPARFRTHQPGGNLDDEPYELELAALQRRLALLTRKRKFASRALVCAFEGTDAAGKGGSIRRLTAALDARQYDVVPISAPTTEELAHPYLWRFWLHVPESGRIAIFDRSWYGRVLVERVRELTPPADWQRAYDEIREFELELAEHDIVVQKFWLAVSKQEQLKRFNERNDDPLKRFKVDPADWENRRRFDDFQVAARDMIERTDTAYAPWTVVPADDKRYARLVVLRTVCAAIEAAL